MKNKHINFNLTRKLSNIGLLDNYDTEYWYNDKGELLHGRGDYPALMLDEAIELLPAKLTNVSADDNMIVRYKIGEKYFCSVQYEEYSTDEGSDGDVNVYYGKGMFSGSSELLAVEQMLEYLIDNNFLCK